MQIYSKEGGLIVVDGTGEPVKMHELERWVSRQREFDKLEEQANGPKGSNLHEMNVEQREEFLMEQQLRENNMATKIDYYWGMLGENRNIKEFEKVYDAELILALGVKMVDTMAMEHERDLATLYKVTQNTTGFDDPAVHIRELEEVKKGNDLRKLVVANEMKRIDDALADFKFIAVDFDPE